MRTIVTAIAGMMLAGTLYGQEVDVCKEIYAPWGSSKIEVMKSCQNSRLTFYEMTDQDEDGMSHVSYVDLPYARVFTFFKGRYISHSFLNMDTPDKRKIFANKQMRSLVRSAVRVVSSSKFEVHCNGFEFTATCSVNADNVTVLINNQTIMAEIASGR